MYPHDGEQPDKLRSFGKPTASHPDCLYTVAFVCILDWPVKDIALLSATVQMPEVSMYQQSCIKTLAPTPSRPKMRASQPANVKVIFKLSLWSII
jgi:hypothetical protein